MNVQAFIDALLGLETSLTTTPNLISATGATVGFEEGTTTGWAPGANVTLALTSAQAHSGSSSAELTVINPGNVDLVTDITGGFGIPVHAGQPYIARAWTQPGTVARNARVLLTWHDAAGAQVGSTVIGSAMTTTLGAWTEVTVTGTVASGATQARVLVRPATGAQIGEVYFVDDISLTIASLPTMTVKRAYWGVPPGELVDLPCVVNVFTEPERMLGFGLTQARETYTVEIQLAVAKVRPDDVQAQRIATEFWFAMKEAFRTNQDLFDGTIATAMQPVIRGADPTVPVLITHGGTTYIGLHCFLEMQAITS